LTFVPRLIGDPSQEFLGQKEPAFSNFVRWQLTKTRPRLHGVLVQVQERSGSA